MHRGRALQDADSVPDDTVDLGEETQLDELGTGEGLDLSFLWIVDARILRPPSSPAASGSALATEGRKRKKQSTSVTNQVKRSAYEKITVQPYGVFFFGRRIDRLLEHCCR